MVSSTTAGHATHPFAPCGAATFPAFLFPTARTIPAEPSSLLSPPLHRLPPSRAAAAAALSGSRERAESYLTERYPRFCDLLRANPAALDRMRGSPSGYAVFAPGDGAFDALGPDRLGLLGAAMAGYDEDMRRAASAMAEYHMVSAPATAEIMATYGVVTTSLGEMPVEVAPDGTLRVNGVRVVRSYQFEDRSAIEYRDGDGNTLGTEEVTAGGGGDKRFVVHEVEGLLCPDELWRVMHAHYHRTAGSGAL
jgi:hypothetical protein